MDGCAAVLRGGDADADLLLALGGPPARRVLTGESRADGEAWARVWAARGLLWALDEATADQVTPAIAEALADPSWRVREKAAQVVARHHLDVPPTTLQHVVEADPTARVRAAAARALRRLATPAATRR